MSSPTIRNLDDELKSRLRHPGAREFVPDQALSVPRLVMEIFGNGAWMRELGRKGGSASSDAKREAARANGRKGGRPAKRAA